MPGLLVTNDNTLEGITRIFSHELVEAVTDPEGNDIVGYCRNMFSSGMCEIADVCQGQYGNLGGVVTGKAFRHTGHKMLKLVLSRGDCKTVLIHLGFFIHRRRSINHGMQRGIVESALRRRKAGNKQSPSFEREYNLKISR